MTILGSVLSRQRAKAGVPASVKGNAGSTQPATPTGSNTIGSTSRGSVGSQSQSRSQPAVAAVATATPPAGFELWVPGECVPWARAGGGKTGHRYTPDKQAKYMTALKLICQAEMKGSPAIEGPIGIVMIAYYPWPKRKTDSTRWKIGRPDADNLAKIVGDALNRIAWIDDSQICSLHVEKSYNTIPGLRVSVRRIT